MKTWWNFWPTLLIVFLAPMLVISSPTFFIRNKPIGGGVIRERLINKFVNIIPTEQGNNIIDIFVSANYIKEVLMITPFSLTIAMLLLTAAALAIKVYMNISNSMKLHQYESERLTSKKGI